MLELFKMYLLAKQATGNIDSGERLHIQLSPLTDSETSCQENFAASGSEYHVMIKSGRSNFKLIGKFD